MIILELLFLDGAEGYGDMKEVYPLELGSPNSGLWSQSGAYLEVLNMNNKSL